jgi:hypothetical protein
MKRYALAAAFTVALASPSFSAAYYIGLRGKACTVMTHPPSPKKYKDMGKYPTRAEANKALMTMPECP